MDQSSWACQMCQPWLIATAILVYLLWDWIRYAHEWMTAPTAKLLSVDVPEQTTSTWKGAAAPDTAPRHPSKSNTIVNVDPGTRTVISESRAMSAADVNAAVAKARAAQPAWAKTTFTERRKFLRLLLDLTLEHQDDILRVSARESGKPTIDGCLGEIITTCEKLQWTLANGEDVLKPESRPVPLLMMHKKVVVEWVPAGVVGAIVSWNYPYHNLIGPLISALFSGSAFVCKVSEHCTWSSLWYGSLFKQALKKLGHSEDLIQIVTGFQEAGAALVAAELDHLTFIGSDGVGKAVMRGAADRLTPVVLELGGKDAAIVVDDVDLDHVVRITLRGFFQNMGQNCIGLERLVMHKSLVERYLAAVTPAVKALRVGPALGNDIVDCGAVCMPSHLQHVDSLVQDAVKSGAKLVTGGHVLSEQGGQFYAPTILVGVKPSMRIAQVEVFGPVLVIMTFETDAEAVNLVNSSPYGLGSSVFARDPKRARRLVDDMRVGMCNVNDFGSNYLCQWFPFGGTKHSGFGRFAGPEGLRGVCLQRVVNVDRFPFIKTDIPPILQYPLSKEASPFAVAINNVLYHPSVKGRLRGVYSILSLLVSFNKSQKKSKSA